MVDLRVVDVGRVVIVLDSTTVESLSVVPFNVDISSDVHGGVFDQSNVALGAVVTSEAADEYSSVITPDVVSVCSGFVASVDNISVITIFSVVTSFVISIVTFAVADFWVVASTSGVTESVVISSVLFDCCSSSVLVSLDESV